MFISEDFQDFQAKLFLFKWNQLKLQIEINPITLKKGFPAPILSSRRKTNRAIGLNNIKSEFVHVKPNWQRSLQLTKLATPANVTLYNRQRSPDQRDF